MEIVLSYGLFFLALFIFSGLRVIDQYERGIILTLGKYSGTKKPGLTWILLGIQKMIKVDMRITTVDVPQQEVITKDNVTMGINAVVYFRVNSAEKAMLEIQDYRHAITLYAQATLRDVIGGTDLDTLLSERDRVAEEIKKIVDIATDPWGINVSDIKIQDMELPADMKRSMAKQAEAERDRRAVIIKAEGEYVAAEKLSMAAERLTANPGGIAIRTLETIDRLSPDPSKMVIFALPVEFLETMKSITKFVENKDSVR
jgi:regulator of protease activity HflC (stomatin/prohibitin superfamily)